MTRGRPQPPLRARILMGGARTLAAVVIAVVASVALAGIGLRPIEFGRVLPIALAAEVILYILLLGGGRIAGPVMLATLVLALALRAGIAVAAAALSPQTDGGLLANARFYYASYWPAAVAQILVMLALLSLIRPLIARRRRMRRPAPTHSVEEIMDDATRDALLTALEEAPDAPPESPTVLEEQQIGDLAEPPPVAATAEPEQQDLALPLDEGGAEEPTPAAAPEAEEEEEIPLPPGVIDATPEALAARAAAEREAAGDVPPSEPTAADRPTAEHVSDEAAQVAEAPAPQEKEPPAEEPAVVAAPATAPSAPAPGEDTAPLEPIATSEPAPPASSAPPEAAAPEVVPQDLRELLTVIARAGGGEDADLRVWAAAHGATILAAVPTGTPAAGTGARADALVRAHAHLCTQVGASERATQLVATPLGGYSLRALDEGAHVLLLLAERGPGAAARLELTSSRVAEAARRLVATVPAAGAPQPAELPPVRVDLTLRARVAAAAQRAGVRLTGEWQAWRRADHRPMLVTTPPGADAEGLARALAALADATEDFTDALALDAPSWLALTDERILCVLAWEPMGEERPLLAAIGADPGSIGRVRWELARLAAAVGEAM